MTDPIKTKYAFLLNRLSQMSEAPYYATAKVTLVEAEKTIIKLEQAIRKAHAITDMLAGSSDAMDNVNIILEEALDKR